MNSMKPVTRVCRDRVAVLAAGFVDRSEGRDPSQWSIPCETPCVKAEFLSTESGGLDRVAAYARPVRNCDRMATDAGVARDEDLGDCAIGYARSHESATPRPRRDAWVP